MLNAAFGWGVAGVGATAAIVFLTLELPPVESVQRGYRGVGLQQVYNPENLEANAAINVVPPPEEPVESGGTPAREVYENVQVLGDLDADQFNRLMTAITNWVSPEQGCNYCHNEENLADDSVYTKIVARKMFQMTQHINANWQSHVGQTGVTCYTCHRGKPVPNNIWFENPGPPTAQGMAGNRAGQNAPAPESAMASLPSNTFSTFLRDDESIRVVGGEALPSERRQSIKQTEWTYGLMMHFSQALGVNCTYCHNSRSFVSWGQSAPVRANAWYGIRMAREINNGYIDTLTGEFPPHRLGPTGDAAKVNCATCHQGAYKPLYGANMVKDYPELRGLTAPATTPVTSLEPEKATTTVR